MISVAFVCLGNICRSPMAELVFKKMARACNLDATADSFGTSDEEEGNGIYPPVRRVLEAHGITGSHTAKQLTLRDAEKFDYIIVMEERNRKGVLRITGGKLSERIHRLCDFTDRPRDVADPWYTRDFDKAYADVCDGCKGLVEYLKGKCDPHS